MQNMKTETILKEKCRFISKNSSFFVNNYKNKIVMLNLKAILLDQKPLTECDTYQDIMEEIKKQNIDKGSDEALNILFHIVYLIRSEAKNEQIREEETEKVREYVKFVNTKIEYINQTSVKIGESGLDQIFSNDKQEKKGRI